jgi:hypothetical protein
MISYPNKYLWENTMIKKSKEHLEKSQESYGSHFVWAKIAGLRLIWAGIASIIHGLIPAFFPGTAAKTVIFLYHKRLLDHPNKEYQDYIDSLKK